MKKKIWLTSLEKTEEAVQGVMSALKQYGMDVAGHFWVDDLEKMAWSESRKELLTEDVKIWIILASAKPFAEASIRYGLSMLALSVQASRGINFPIVILQLGDESVEAASLPTPFNDAVVYPVGESYGPKLVAALHKRVVPVYPPYRLDVYAIPQIGQWFETGPRDGEWQGAIFATNVRSIVFQAVGPAGQLPEKTTLNYAQQGLKIDCGGVEFDGWAVQNELDEQSSYFVKVDDHPGTIMFCPFTQDDEAEAYILTLK